MDFEYIKIKILHAIGSPRIWLGVGMIKCPYYGNKLIMPIITVRKMCMFV